jgi:hypothetical protein
LLEYERDGHPEPRRSGVTANRHRSAEWRGVTSCDILVRSHARDFPWLELSLRSIRRFCAGFRSVVLVVPRSSEPWLRRFDLAADEVDLCDDVADDYLGQQVTKLYADEHSDAEIVVHLDSDCIVDRRLTPDALLDGERPVIPITPYATLGRSVPWRPVTERALGFPVAHDYMRTMPLAYPRWLYAALRSHVASVHGTEIRDYVLAQPPRGFSEFYALGAFAHRLHSEAFVWQVVDCPEQTPRHCRWYWSWNGLDAATRREIDEILSRAQTELAAAKQRGAPTAGDL